MRESVSYFREVVIVIVIEYWRGHQLWGSIGRLDSWLGLDGVGQGNPQIKLRRLALNGDGERDGRKLELIDDVGIGGLARGLSSTN